MVGWIPQIKPAGCIEINQAWAVTKTDYIPELSEVRMVRRAPEGPFDFSEDDRDYIGRCLADVQSAFALKDFAGMTVDTISGRALIKHFID